MAATNHERVGKALELLKAGRTGFYAASVDYTLKDLPARAEDPG